jgi:hypothetical protein
VLFHQFGQDLVLGLELPFQGSDAFLVALTARVGAMILESGGPLLEELLQPAVEDRRMKAVFLTEVRNRNLLDQVPAQDADFLFRGVVLAL